MVQKRATMSKNPAAQRHCHHHWMVEMATGPSSRGVCKFCGAQRDFTSYFPDCLDKEGKGYGQWSLKGRHEDEDTEPEEDVFSRLLGGDRNAN